MSNIICSVVFGSRFDYDDDRLLTIIHLINENFQIMSCPWGEVRRPSSTGDRVGGSSQLRAFGEEVGREGIAIGPALSV